MLIKFLAQLKVDLIFYKSTYFILYVFNIINKPLHSNAVNGIIFFKPNIQQIILKLFKINI